MEAVSEEAKVHISDLGSAVERSRTMSAEVLWQHMSARTPATSLVREALAAGTQI